MSESLMPCPFCGGEAEVRYQSNLYGVRCKKCLATVAAFDTEAEAIEAWNRRVATDKNVGDKERTAKVDTRPFGDIDLHKCHHCQYYVDKSFTYCPGCGAKLDWGGHE